MNIDALLIYQEKDSELVKLTRRLDNGENKKKLEECKEVARKATIRSAELEELARKAKQEFSDAEVKIEQTKKSLETVLAKDITKLNTSELANMQKIADKITNNLVILAKFLTKLAEKIKNILLEFNQVKKQHSQASQNYTSYLKIYEDECNELQPKIEEIKKELKVLKKDIDDDLFKAYMQRRDDNIFPVIVPIENKLCGRCRMELPNIALSKINEKGIISCEHCKRLNYKK